MNNTKTLAIVAVLTAATLVVGLTVSATSAAFAFKKGQDNRKMVTQSPSRQTNKKGQ